MIIDDVNESTTLKASQPPRGTPQRRPSPSPPPYVSYQAITPSFPRPVLAARRKNRQRKPQRRKHLIAASFVLNCLLVVLLVRIVRRERGPNGEDDESARIPLPEFDPPVIRAVVPDSRLGRCTRSATWSNATRSSPDDDDFPFSSNASFRFPDSSSLMFLLSQGALSGGELLVVPSSEAVPRIVVQARYHSLHVRDRANVCWMERKHVKGEGLGVFTPAPFDGQAQTDKLDFTITLLLPTRDASSPSLPIYNLETHLPSFTHILDSLRGTLEFDHLSLRSQNRPIVAESVYAKNATIHTSNGHISGSFEASNALSLVTSNAPIDASVTLHSTNIFTTTDLVLQTRNAQLESAIRLRTTAASGEGGKFSVQASTSDGPLVLSFPASPAHALLTLDAQTANAPADVYLHPAFEGAFTLAASMVVVDRRPFLDPRKLRSVLFSEYQTGVVVGDVRWKMPIFRSKVRGKVRVATTNHILKFFV